jgi:hypothetical protein
MVVCLKETLSMKYKINKGFIVQKIGEKSTIFDGENSILFTFNKTGTLIFEKIKLRWDKDKIVEHISQSYLISKKEAKTDVDEFINTLIESKVIKMV